MRPSLAYCSLALLMAAIALSGRAQADVSVGIPGATGLYVADHTVRHVTVDLGGPPGLVALVFMAARGSMTPGSAVCSGGDPQSWGGTFYACVEDSGFTDTCAEISLLEGGPFDAVEKIVNPQGGCLFAEDGIIHMMFYLQTETCADPGFELLSAPECSLDLAVIYVVGPSPVVGATWGAVKCLYEN